MKFAIVFPGQGSQSVGMLNDFADDTVVQMVIAQASAALEQDIAQLIMQGPEAQLALTVNTQPVMLTAGMAIYRAWLAAGGKVPAVMAGHSLGEYTAYVAAGVFDFSDALRLVRFRAQSMQDAVPVGTGAMAAILGLDDEAVRAICLEASATGLAEAVNFNAPAQVVIAGTQQGVTVACELAKARGAKRALILPVSAPFHSSLMSPASICLRDYLVNTPCMTPTVKVINNVDVRIEQQPDAIKDALVRQASAPVRWVETIRAMVAMGVTHIIECGPGKVLTGLVKRIAPEVVTAAIVDKATLKQALMLMHSSVEG